MLYISILIETLMKPQEGIELRNRFYIYIYFNQEEEKQNTDVLVNGSVL